MGAWLSYGLGSENADLPAYIVLTSGVSDGQPLLQSFWGNGFLESQHAGVPFRNTGAPVLHLGNPPGVQTADRRRELDLIQMDESTSACCDWRSRDRLANCVL